MGVTRDGNDITFEAVNVRIVNGTGSTDGGVNGLGNLIVGAYATASGGMNNFISCREATYKRR